MAVDYWNANETQRVGKRIAERFAGVNIIVWDVSEFFKAFHDVRRNIVFIQAEKDALEPILSAVATDKTFANYLFYIGDRKPKTLNEKWAQAKSDEIRNIVVLMPKNIPEKLELPMEGYPENLKTVDLEYRAAELATYSLRGHLPISPEEAVAALAWLMRQKETEIAVLRTYAQRNYQGWLVDYLCYLILKEDQRQVKQRTPIQTIQLENVMRKKYEENGALIARAIEEAQQQ